MINKNITLEGLNTMYEKGDHISKLLGIEITEIGADYVCGKMPVDARTVQPVGILHGGASVVLAESLGSIGGNCCVDFPRQYCVGLEVNANHLRSASSGWVYGKASIVFLGKQTQVWDIRITNEEDKMVCISRLTLAVKEKI
jgi:1,4-dihydroxy-2-naphthoyl-CoA hydrolase